MGDGGKMVNLNLPNRSKSSTNHPKLGDIKKDQKGHFCSASNVLHLVKNPKDVSHAASAYASQR